MSGLTNEIRGNKKARLTKTAQPSLKRGEWESNPRVTDLQSVALATWLSPQNPEDHKSIGQFERSLTPELLQRFIPNVSASGLLCCTVILPKICGNARSWNGMNRILAKICSAQSAVCESETGRSRDIRDSEGFGGSRVERQNFRAYHEMSVRSLSCMNFKRIKCRERN